MPPKAIISNTYRGSWLILAAIAEFWAKIFAGIENFSMNAFSRFPTFNSFAALKASLTTVNLA